MSPSRPRRPETGPAQGRRTLVLALLGLVVAAGLAGCLDIGATPQTTFGNPIPDGETDPAGAAPSAGPDPRTPSGFTDTHIFPGDYETDGSRSEPLHPGTYDGTSYEVVTLESRVDGSALEVGLVRPQVPDGVTVPVIVVASPHYADTPSSGSGDLRSYDRAMWYVEHFAPHGYAVALHPVRGADGDGACAEPLGPRVREELDQLATWLGTRNWTNGNISFVGLSSDGSSAWLAASTGNPHVRTIVPVAGRNDLHLSLFRNGTFREASTRAAAAYPYSRLAEAGPANDRVHATQRSVCPSFATAATETAHGAATGRPGPTGFWANHTARPGLEKAYQGSVFVVHGFGDEAISPRNILPWIQDLPDEGVPVKLWLGRWGHDLPDEADDPDVGPEEIRWDYAETLLHWFDYWLKGETSRDLGPRVQVQDSQGRWRSGDAWPPPDASPARRYLAPRGKLADAPTDSSEALPVAPSLGRTAEAVVDVERPGAPWACPTCHRFASEPLDEPLRFAGTPQVQLTVTPFTPTGYVTAELLHRTADGTVPLTGGQAALAAVDGTPGPPEPGRGVEIRVPLDPVDAHVPEGDSIELVVSQSGYQGFVGRPGSFQVHVGDGQSTLSVAIFEAPPGAFFTPPTG